tara:strand:+ start:8909 stop:9415 length:507 start_codon:yes stop_codon:yes gene_type:complete
MESMNKKVDFVLGIARQVAQDKLLLTALVVIFLSSFAWFNEEPVPQNTQSMQGLDTMIPAGHSLIPIDIEMSEKLDSLIGPYGKVNLYFVHPNGKSRYVARAVKLLRAPKNPNVFAVLVPYRHVSWFMSLEGRFRVSLASQQEEDGTFLVTPSARKSKVHYGVKNDFN